MSEVVHRPMMISWPQDARAVEAATPVSFGIDLPEGQVREAGRLRVELSNGRTLPAQATTLGTWHDGSVRWLLVDCVIPAGVQLEGSWHVCFESRAETDSAEVGVRESAGAIQLDSGAWTLSLDKRTGGWTAAAGEQPLAQAALPEVTDAKGRRHLAVVKHARLVAAGPVRATVEVEAEYRRLRGLRIVARWSIFAGTDLLAAEITLHNPRRARHRGGLWDLGDPGSILFEDFTQSVSLSGFVSTCVRCRLDPNQPVLTIAGPLEVYQESSGGDHWNSRNHVNRHGQVPLRLRGYQGRAGGESLAGLRAQPAVEIASEFGALTAEIEHFWQQFPKAIEAEGGEIRMRLFPGQFPDLHELQGGEQKTHRLWLELNSVPGSITVPKSDTVPTSNTVSASLASPLHFPRAVQPLSLTPLAIPGLPDWTNADPEVLERLDDFAEEFLTGPRGVYANRERVDEFCWRNWGELHADHEELHYHGPQPLVSHYNNQFDVVLGFLLQYLRTGDERWMELARPLARHVIDIDIYHTTEDRPAYSGGLFWMTDHYRHAHTCTHRTYSQRNCPSGRNAYGGGPSCEHNYTTGLVLYHLLTGDSQARAAVLSLANWVIAMDDGRRTLLGLFDGGPTGLASCTASDRFQGPGRGAANSLGAVLDAWWLTRDARYWEFACTLVDRVVHPFDDLTSMRLLEAEHRWSYTMFLAALHRFVVCCAERPDGEYWAAYAASCMAHYGRWMCDNERPYLDAPQDLEHPEEAWAAQELRKANALARCAYYCEGETANGLRSRAASLARRAWSDLMRFEHRASLRPIAIVLTEGVQHAALARTPPTPLPLCAQARPYWPPRKAFVSQRERLRRAIRRPMQWLIQ